MLSKTTDQPTVVEIQTYSQRVVKEAGDTTSLQWRAFVCGPSAGSNNRDTCQGGGRTAGGKTPSSCQCHYCCASAFRHYLFFVFFPFSLYLLYLLFSCLLPINLVNKVDCKLTIAYSTEKRTVLCACVLLLISTLCFLYY